MNEQERMERILGVIEDLTELNEEAPVVVEGQRDVRSLRNLGLSGEITKVNTGGTLVQLCEALSRQWPRVIILTDWDRRGGQLARRLREGLLANGTEAIDDVRAKLAYLSRKDIKDVESLHAYVERVREALASGRHGKSSKRWYAEQVSRRR